jgi:hypothetical protein
LSIIEIFTLKEKIITEGKMRKYLFYGIVGVLSCIITFGLCFTEPLFAIRLNHLQIFFSIAIGSIIFTGLAVLDPLRKYFKKFNDEKEIE